MAIADTRTIVLIHGLWVTTDSWAPFRARLEAAGYTVHTPTWHVLQGASAEHLNHYPPPALGKLTLGTIVDGLQTFIEALPEKPLLIGHSFGGLHTQMLLDRGVGAAGVAINPAPIAGIIHGPTTLTAALPILARWNGWSRPYAFTRARWARRYANAAPKDQQDAAYDSYVIPTSGRVAAQAAFWLGSGIDPKRRTAPLLITAGDRDRLITPYMSKAAFGIQRRSAARTDYHLFPGRSHLLIAEPGWEEVCDYAVEWAKGL